LPYKGLYNRTIIDGRGSGYYELNGGRIGNRLIRNEAELAIVVGLKIVVMVQGRNYSADCDHPGDDCNGKNAEK
jgi:hypothetical protein